MSDAFSHQTEAFTETIETVVPNELECSTDDDQQVPAIDTIHSLDDESNVAPLSIDEQTLMSDAIQDNFARADDDDLSTASMISSISQTNAMHSSEDTTQRDHTTISHSSTDDQSLWNSTSSDRFNVEQETTPEDPFVPLDQGEERNTETPIDIDRTVKTPSQRERNHSSSTAIEPADSDLVTLDQTSLVSETVAHLASNTFPEAIDELASSSTPDTSARRTSQSTSSTQLILSAPTTAAATDLGLAEDTTDKRQASDQSSLIAETSSNGAHHPLYESDQSPVLAEAVQQETSYGSLSDRYDVLLDHLTRITQHMAVTIKTHVAPVDDQPTDSIPDQNQKSSRPSKKSQRKKLEGLSAETVDTKKTIPDASQHPVEPIRSDRDPSNNIALEAPITAHNDTGSSSKADVRQSAAKSDQDATAEGKEQLIPIPVRPEAINDAPPLESNPATAPVVEQANSLALPIEPQPDHSPSRSLLTKLTSFVANALHIAPDPELISQASSNNELEQHDLPSTSVIPDRPSAKRSSPDRTPALSQRHALQDSYPWYSNHYAIVDAEAMMHRVCPKTSAIVEPQAPSVSTINSEPTPLRPDIGPHSGISREESLVSQVIDTQLKKKPKKKKADKKVTISSGISPALDNQSTKPVQALVALTVQQTITEPLNSAPPAKSVIIDEPVRTPSKTDKITSPASPSLTPRAAVPVQDKKKQQSTISESNVPPKLTVATPAKTPPISTRPLVVLPKKVDEEDNEGFQLVSYRKRIPSAIQPERVPSPSVTPPAVKPVPSSDNDAPQTTKSKKSKNKHKKQKKETPATSSIDWSQLIEAEPASPLSPSSSSMPDVPKAHANDIEDDNDGFRIVRYRKRPPASIHAKTIPTLSTRTTHRKNLHGRHSSTSSCVSDITGHSKASQYPTKQNPVTVPSTSTHGNKEVKADRIDLVVADQTTRLTSKGAEPRSPSSPSTLINSIAITIQNGSHKPSPPPSEAIVNPDKTKKKKATPASIETSSALLPEEKPATVDIHPVKTIEIIEETPSSKSPAKRRKKKPRPVKAEEEENGKQQPLLPTDQTLSNFEEAQAQVNPSPTTKTLPQHEGNSKLDIFLPDYIRQQIHPSEPDPIASPPSVHKKKQRTKMLNKDIEAKHLLTNEFDDITHANPCKEEPIADTTLSHGFHRWLHESQVLSQTKERPSTPSQLTHTMQSLIIQPADSHDEPTYMSGVRAEKRMHARHAYQINQPGSTAASPSFLFAREGDPSSDRSPFDPDASKTTKKSSSNPRPPFSSGQSSDSNCKSNAAPHHKADHFSCHASSILPSLSMQMNLSVTSEQSNTAQDDPPLNFDDWAYFLQQHYSSPKTSHSLIDPDPSTSLGCFYARALNEDTLISDALPIDPPRRYGDFLFSADDAAAARSESTVPAEPTLSSLWKWRRPVASSTEDDDEILLSHSDNGLSRHVRR